jgi:1-acyl-sn-glycerol-3-phosphate acyltransferase
MIWILNVKIYFQNDFPDAAGIIMANHRSYVDILLFPSRVPIVFVAKAEVRRWPVIGWGGNAMNTVWVARNSKESRRTTRMQLQERLKTGESVVVFPEGTTHRGPEILELRPGMFHAVAQGGFPIIAVAIEYKDPTIAFIDDDLFVWHFFKNFAKPRIEVLVKFSDPIRGSDGELLKGQVTEWLTEQVLEFRRRWDNEEEGGYSTGSDEKKPHQG